MLNWFCVDVLDSYTVSSPNCNLAGNSPSQTISEVNLSWW